MTIANISRVALVTGGSGFVGSNLISRLISDGWQVHAIIRSSSNLSELNPVIGSVVLHEYDGTTESLVKILKAAQPVIVFHLASLFLSTHTASDVSPLLESNILFSTQLLEAMSRNNIRLLINTGTSWQHYENKDYSPVNLYASTKQAFEAILEYYIEANNFRVITLKLFDTYGPNDPRPKLIHLLRKAAISQEPLAMSTGEQLIDLVYIDDVIEAYLIAAHRIIDTSIQIHHERYGLSSGNPISLKKLSEIIETASNVKLPIQWGARPYRNREVMLPWSNYQRLPNWSAKVSIRDGIRKLFT